MTMRLTSLLPHLMSFVTIVSTSYISQYPQLRNNNEDGNGVRTMHTYTRLPSNTFLSNIAICGDSSIEMLDQGHEYKR